MNGARNGWKEECKVVGRNNGGRHGLEEVRKVDGRIDQWKQEQKERGRDRWRKGWMGREIYRRRER